MLTPLVIGRGRPFPYISNLSLSLAVVLRDPEKDNEILARVKVPKELLRPLPLRRRRGQHPGPARRPDRRQPRLAVPGHGGASTTRSSGSPATPTTTSPTRPTTCCRRSRRSSAAGASARSCGSRSMREMSERLRDQLIVGPRRLERRGLRDRRADRPRRPLGRRRDLRPRRPALPALHPGDAAAPAVRRGGQGGRPVRRDPRRRHPRPPSLRLVHDHGRALRQAGGLRPRRAGDQADRVPDERRLAAGPGADRGRRARQAGRLPGGAEGALRRERQHPLGEEARAGRRPRRLRDPGAEDPRQVRARRPPRGRRRPPLRPHRDRQLQPEDGADLHRPRPVHLRIRRSAPTSPRCSTR